MSRRGAHTDEPATRVDDVATAELGKESRRVEEPLEDPPARSVLQHSFLPFRSLDPTVERGVDDDELWSNSACFGEEAQTLLFLEVAVEMAREDAPERAVLERQGESVSENELCARVSSRRHLQPLKYLN